MTPENFSKILLKKQAELQQFLQNYLPRYVGKIAVDFRAALISIDYPQCNNLELSGTQHAG